MAIYGDVPHSEYRWLQVTGSEVGADCWLNAAGQICVSDRMMTFIEAAELSDCLVEELSE